MTSTITKEQFRAIMGSFAAGVTVVTTVDASGALFGLTATAFSSLSLDPPLCLVCIDNRAGSLPALLESKRFAVNMLRADQTDLSNRFASPIPNKLEGVSWQPGPATECPLLEGTIASMECTVVNVFPGGDHQILIGELQRISVAEGDPLLYFRGGYADLARRPKA